MRLQDKSENLQLKVFQAHARTRVHLTRFDCTLVGVSLNIT